MTVDPETRDLDPAGDPCVACGTLTISVCGHCERPVCPDDLLAHWREACDLSALGPFVQALLGLGGEEVTDAP
jgi:hypothetical protein